MKRVLTLYRDAYSGLSPSLWWLSIVMLINRAGTMVIPFMTLYLTQYLDYSISKAGIIMAVFGIGLCVEVIWGDGLQTGSDFIMYKL